MVQSYTSERADRIAYLERSKSNAERVLSRRTVQNALGSNVTRLLTLARGLYAPDVSQEGLVTLSDTTLQSDALPALTLRDDERVRRDHTFATFAPRQYTSAPPDKTVYFDTITSRVIAGPEDAFAAQTFEQNAAVMRMTYGIPHYPTPDDVTYFNLRPLLLLRYDPATESAKPSVVVNALVMANLVLENPVTVVSGEEAFDALNAAWVLTGEEAGGIIDGLSQTGPLFP